MALPSAVDGIAWAAGPDEGSSGVVAKSALGEALRAHVSTAEIAPGEWRATLNLEFAPGMDAGPALRALAPWAENMARDLLQQALREGALVTLCVNIEGDDFRLAPHLAQAGLKLAVAEDEYHHDLQVLSAAALPGNLTFAAWDEHAAPLFFHAYSSAFRDRPGFPDWDEQRWRRAFTSSADFRPDISMVILDGPEPAGFAILWVESATGWITQMGVRPGWRGRGLGEALLASACRAFAGEGLEKAALEVATNNPNARALYKRMGFQKAGSYQSWRKSVT